MTGGPRRADTIQHAVWLYFRFALSLRDVEYLLAEHGIEVSYETIRCWTRKFGHGRITKQGRTHARTTLVEAAWQAVRGPGPLRGFYQRVSTRRGNHIAAVAVARKLAVIVWHMLQKGEDYAGVRPALHAKKLRDLELRSGQPARRGQRGSTYAYNLTRSRLEEKRRAEQAEVAYRRLTEGWTKRGRRVPTGAVKEERL